MPEAPTASAGLSPGLACELRDLVARLTAVQARIAPLEAELVRVAQPLPAYALLRTLPGVGPTVAAILLAEIGDIAWFTKFTQLRKLVGLDIQRLTSGQWAGTARISRCGKPLLRWALYQAALGACRNPGWRARREALRAKRAGDPHAFFKATVELAAKLLRLVWGIWRERAPLRSGADRRAPRGPVPPGAGPPRGPTSGPGAGGDRGTWGHPGWSELGHPDLTPGKGATQAGVGRIPL